MAEVEQDESIESNFEDDLDKMLQETVEQLDDDVTSQAAIDKLLTADDDLSPEEDGNVDDLVDSLLDESAQEQAEDVIDEFGEDPTEPETKKAEDAASDLVDDLLDKSLEEKPFDEFGETEEVALAEATNTSEEEEDASTFDISDDDTTFAEEEPATSESEIIPEASTPEPKEATQVINLSEIKAQDEKITRLGNEITELRKHFDYSEAIEKLTNNEKKAKNEAESAQKTLKILSICALVIAVLAVGVGSTVLFFNLQLEETVEEAQNSLMDIEDEMSIREVNPNDEKIKTVQSRVAELQETLDASAKELDLLKSEISSDKSDASSLNIKVTQLTDKVIALESELEHLKKARSVRKTSRKVQQKTRKSREWVVNLVSFKQRWYTDKKVENFSQQGIPTEVISIDVNGVKWFRIRAVGFYSKAAARDYAEKAKKVLNLSSVWVSAK